LKIDGHLLNGVGVDLKNFKARPLTRVAH